MTSFNSLNDLVPAKRGWTEFFRGFVPSPHARTPAGIAFAGDCLYVCDIGYNVVHRWDLATGQSKRFGAGSKPELLKPVDVAVDDAGSVYVADTELAEVVAFDAGGVVLRRFAPTDRKDYRPVAVAVSGSKLYVADIVSHRVDIYATDGGEHLGSFGGPGGEPGRLFFPLGLAVSDDGRVCVADMMNSRVQVFDAQNQPVLSVGRPGNRYGDLGKPRRVAVGPDGVIFVADVDFAHIHLFDSRGRLLMLFGGPEDKPDGTPMPAGVAVASSLPPRLVALVPDDFHANYFLFVADKVGAKRISLYAIGTARGVEIEKVE